MLKHDIIRLLDSFVSINIDNEINNKLYINALQDKAHLIINDNAMHIIDNNNGYRATYSVNDLHDIIEVWGEFMDYNGVC